ncbi:MAG: hypothetical protein ACJ75S_06985 [Solirubrobacterales bacterium]
MEPEIEKIARAMLAVSRPGLNPDDLTPAPRGQLGMMPKWKLFEHLARAAYEVMARGDGGLRAHIADLESRLEIVRVKIDGEPFDFPRQTMGINLLMKVRNSNDYHLAREIEGGEQAEDISDQFEALMLNEGDSFVTFPGARYC